MGVPAFYRWVSRKYPSVIVECVEQKSTDGDNLYNDLTTTNPNKVEFDNLYLDMNGIIHQCTHSEDKPAPKNEDEMMVAIFECIDRLMNIVRPRKVLYMAIDGVAPRAKTNQQRSRRFRASKEAAEKSAEIQRIRAELAAKGCVLPPEKEKADHLDSSCITPGTPFMDRLSKCLQYYIHERMNSNAGWKGLKVILSDADVPGEGEHKIMDYIRKQRAQQGHDPNTHHVLCGADADLIMLGLATHETHFTIIREEFLPNKERPCDICQRMGHEMKDCTGLHTALDVDVPPLPSNEIQYIFVRLNVLREYLQKELYMPNLPFEYDFERVIDDWVFMCLFVDNDFLPHLPSLEIRENAIDRLIALYKKCVYKTKSYLTDTGSVSLESVEVIMADLGYAEDEIFRRRKITEDRLKQRNKRMKMEKQREQRPNFDGIFAPMSLGKDVTPQAIVNPRQEARFRIYYGNQSQSEQTNDQSTENRRGQKRRVEEDIDPEEEPETPDVVRLSEDGFKDRYYESKFGVMPQNVEFRQTVAWEYMRGLCWVLKYYYQGCPSWEWYFPNHYAPFASDFRNLSNVNTHFERGTPCKPLFKATDSGLRNENGLARLYLTSGSDAYRTVKALYQDNVDYECEVPILDESMRGLIIPTKENIPLDGVLPSPIPGLHPVRENKVLTMKFLDPKYADDFIYPSRKLKGARDQSMVLGTSDGPVIGFGPRTDRGCLGNAGHRMVNPCVGFRDNNSNNSPSNSTNFSHKSGDNANTKDTTENRCGMSAFEQLSSRINELQQQLLDKISRNNLYLCTGPFLTNPFDSHLRYDHNSSNNQWQNSGHCQNSRGYNQNQLRGRNMETHNNRGGGQYYMSNQDGYGSGAKQKFNNQFDNGGGNRYSSNHSGGNRVNNRKSYSTY